MQNENDFFYEPMLNIGGKGVGPVNDAYCVDTSAGEGPNNTKASMTPASDMKWACTALSFTSEEPNIDPRRPAF